MKIPKEKYIDQQFVDAWKTAANQIAVELGLFVEVGMEYAESTTTTHNYQTIATISSGCSSAYAGTGSYQSLIGTTANIPAATTTITSGGTIAATSTARISIGNYVPNNTAGYGANTGYGSTNWGGYVFTNLKRIFFKWEDMEFENLTELKKALKLHMFI